MKQRIMDEIKFDVGLKPTSLASGAATGSYFNMANWRKALFHCKHAAMVAAGTLTLQAMQAKNQAAGSAKVVTNASAVNALLVGGQQMSIVAATLLTGTAITVSLYRVSQPTAGTAATMTLVLALTYTFAAGANVNATRTIGLGANDTAAMANLILLLNDPVVGIVDPLTGKLVVVATASTVTVTITSIDDNYVFGLASAPDDSTDVKAYVAGQLIVEIDKSALDFANGFTWVAARVTSASATVIADVTLARIGRFSAIPQQVEQLGWL
jgi:hypothetical protein